MATTRLMPTTHAQMTTRTPISAASPSFLRTPLRVSAAAARSSNVPASARVNVSRVLPPALGLGVPLRSSPVTCRSSSSRNPAPDSNGGDVSGGSGSSGRGPGSPRGPGNGGNFGPKLPEPPGDWTWRQAIFVALGFLLTVPLLNYVKERMFNKPQEPEVEIEREAARSKGRLSQMASSVKHSTVDPVKSAFNRYNSPQDVTEDVKRSDTARGVQHKAEDVKDKADTKFYDVTSKGERKYSHAQQDMKQTAEDVREKAGDVGSSVDRTAHKASVKGGRILGERVPEKASDVAHDTKMASKSTGKSVMEKMKCSATRVGKALHIVADTTEKGTKTAVNKAEKVSGMTPTEEQKRNAYYTAGGVALGLAAMGGLYYYDRNGGDLGGKFRQMQGKTRDLSRRSSAKAQDAAEKSFEKGKESLDKAKDAAAKAREAAQARATSEPSGVFRQ